MKTYTVGDVEQMVGIKIHVIRYWEKEIPMLQPKRDKSGRRIYTNREVQILMRLKHLLYERHFTIEGARHQLFIELSGENQDLHAQIALFRAELLEIYSKACAMGQPRGKDR
jgi:DNA-binding transcriptional MerR regulator